MEEDDNTPPGRYTGIIFIINGKGNENIRRLEEWMCLVQKAGLEFINILPKIV
jgi:hypothetical protein